MDVFKAVQAFDIAVFKDVQAFDIAVFKAEYASATAFCDAATPLQADRMLVYWSLILR